MAGNRSFQVNPGWQVFLTDLGIRPPNLLRRAGLPEDIWGRAKVVPNATRKELARHYVKTSDLTGAEIPLGRRCNQVRPHNQAGYFPPAPDAVPEPPIPFAS